MRRNPMAKPKSIGVQGMKGENHAMSFFDTDDPDKSKLL